MKPTRSTVRTLQNRRLRRLPDEHGVVVEGRGHDPKAPGAMLEAKPIQLLFRSRVAPPFDTRPEECKKIVMKLAPRGLHVAAPRLSRIAGRRAAG